ncbi:MAG: WD40/YVTN/BNR-like repeat-containing protein [Panacagrimonas sp.]
MSLSMRTAALIAWTAIAITAEPLDARESSEASANGMTSVVAGDFQSIAYNGKTLVAVSNAGVARSADSGKSWARDVMPTGSSLIDVATCPDKTFAALDFYKGVWIGDADGQNWVRSAMPTDFTPMALTCSPKGEIWTVGTFSTLARSGDRGKTWTISQVGEDAILTAVQFVSDSEAIAVGEFGIVLVTVDGGATWNMLPRVPDEFYPFDAWFQSTQVGWLTGRGGRILSTHDGGATWCDEPNTARIPMYGFVPTSSSGLMAIGELGMVMTRQSNGTWTPLQSASYGGYLRGAVFLPSTSSLVVVGGSGARTPAVISLTDP